MPENIPPDLAAVVGPLREAEDYARLQAIRQRGLYNVVTGLPMFWLLVPTWISWIGPPSAPGFSFWNVLAGLAGLIAFILFVLSCFPTTFLPLVRRFRPDWTSPLLDAGLLKNRLEKQFWFQFPFWCIQYLLIPFIVVLVVLDNWSDLPRHDPFDLLRLLAPFVFEAAMVTLAWHAWRMRDRLVMAGFLTWIPIGIIVTFLDPGSQFPSLVVWNTFTVALVSPPLVAGFVRLWSPRRWLLR